MTKIGYYKNINDATSKDTLSDELFFDAVKAGKWQDKILSIRIIADHNDRQAAKKTLPYVTMSGVFSERRAANMLTLHSGLLAMDVDNIGSEVEAIKRLLSFDPYVYACFVSASGNGLCVVFKIDKERHIDAFNGIADYLIKNYQIIIDPSGKDVSRPRYVSYDPFLYYNEKASTFKKYLAKNKSRKIQATIFVKDEFDDVVKKMVDQNVNCVEDYRDWLSIGFGLADKFGEAGRPYFHSLSSISNKYESSMCDRQYTHCLKGGQNNASKITIATIYWFAKQAGINTTSEKTNKIAAATSSMKKSGLDAKAISENLKKISGIENADEIIQQAFANEKDYSKEGSIIDNVQMWLKLNYDIKRNSITRFIEVDGVNADDIIINSLFLNAKILFDDLNFDLFYKILTSDRIPGYNPFDLFFKNSEPLRFTGYVDSLCKALKTDDEERTALFLTKWLVSLVASMHGHHSPLVLVLVGKQNCGKTQFFRRLLPKELSAYYAEDNFSGNEKDLEILMTKKILIVNDEMGGKSKKESARLKELTSKQIFTLREPYGRASVELVRLSCLGGTTNDDEVLDDPTGNRRILPIKIEKIDYDLFNQIDKTQLFLELKQMYDNGYNYELTSIEIEELNKNSHEFEKVSIEGELITKFYEPMENSLEMTCTEIKVFLEQRTSQKLNLVKLGGQLKKLGFTQRFKIINFRKSRVYFVNQIIQ
jgi:predicted P-loop ATPase